MLKIDNRPPGWRRPYGQYSAITLRGKGHRIITIVTAYQVVDTSIAHSSDTTVFKQLWSIKRKSGISQPNL
jgi:hypothetical protein